MKFKQIGNPCKVYFRASPFINYKKYHIFAYMSGQDDLLAKLRQTLNEQGIDSFHILEDLFLLRSRWTISDISTGEKRKPPPSCAMKK